MDIQIQVRFYITIVYNSYLYVFVLKSTFYIDYFSKGITEKWYF